MDWLIACIPILSFGLLPVVATYIGGKPVQQSMGIALGSMLFAIIFFLIKQPVLNTHICIVSFFSGLFWAIGSVGQFMGIRYLGVSKSIPILNGGQIIGTSLLGVLLGDWATSGSRLFGFSALILIITGILFTSYKDEKNSLRPDWKKGIGINLLAILGYTLYIGILKYYQIDGWSSILPQSFGQVAGILLISLCFFKTLPFSHFTTKNISVGIIWATGNIALLISQLKIGLAVAYPVSQAAIIISVLGGVFINKEHKTGKEWKYATIGMIVILSGLYLIYLSNLYDTA